MERILYKKCLTFNATRLITGNNHNISKNITNFHAVLKCVFG